jgi:hypothetical protein
VPEHVRVEAHVDRLPAPLEHLPDAVGGEPALLRQPQPRLVHSGMLPAGSQVAVERLGRPSSDGVTAFPQVVDRGGIDPPTFRFSGGRSSD